MKASVRAFVTPTRARSLTGLCLALVMATGLPGCSVFERSWHRWEAFRTHFIQADGRVIDRTDGARSTSEGQAYGLFFALVANEPQTFASILSWTTHNLAQGSLTAHLPAWLWGQRDDGSWGVIDANPATDADLWIAYTLLEASRLWDVPQYAVIADKLLGQIVRRTVIKSSDGLEFMLPAPEGFDLGGGRYRLNPSYLPEFQFRYLAEHQPSGPWRALIRNHTALVISLAQARGLAPDWVVYGPEGVAFPDGTEPHGSYDAIRVYLWAGMTPGSDSLAALHGMHDLLAVAPRPPERVDVLTGEVLSQGSPVGFSAALLPYLNALGDDKALEAQQLLIEAADRGGLLGDVPAYYDHVLSLFGEGQLDGWYRFDETGRIIPNWERSCWLIFGDC